MRHLRPAWAPWGWVSLCSPWHWLRSDAELPSATSSVITAVAGSSDPWPDDSQLTWPASIAFPFRILYLSMLVHLSLSKVGLLFPLESLSYWQAPSRQLYPICNFSFLIFLLFHTGLSPNLVIFAESGGPVTQLGWIRAGPPSRGNTDGQGSRRWRGSI